MKIQGVGLNIRRASARPAKNSRNESSSQLNKRMEDQNYSSLQKFSFENYGSGC